MSLRSVRCSQRAVAQIKQQVDLRSQTGDEFFDVALSRSSVIQKGRFRRNFESVNGAATFGSA